MKHIDYYLDVIQQNKTESTGGGTGGITPSGTKEISIVQNGESTEDVTRYASAHIVVDVPMPEPPTGVKEISVTENGVSTHDVSAFAQAEVTVAVPEPAGEKQITTNGKHDVKAFASVDVNVPSEGITPTGVKEITSNGTHDVTQYAQAKVNVPIPAEPAGTKDITLLSNVMYVMYAMYLMYFMFNFVRVGCDGMRLFVSGCTPHLPILSENPVTEHQFLVTNPHGRNLSPDTFLQ